MRVISFISCPSGIRQNGVVLPSSRINLGLWSSSKVVHEPKRFATVSRMAEFSLSKPPLSAASTTTNPALAGIPVSDLPSRELQVAIDVVRRAASICYKVKRDTNRLVSMNKSDSTPVTLADIAIQSYVGYVLSQQFGADGFIAEEDTESLLHHSKGCMTTSNLVESAMKLVHEECGNSDMADHSDWDIASFLSLGKTRWTGANMQQEQSPGSRFWVLDPIDGTAGYKSDQGYSVGLALIDAHTHECVLGVVGVPEHQAGRHGTVIAAHRGFGCYQAAILPIDTLLAREDQTEKVLGEDCEAAIVSDQLHLVFPIDSTAERKNKAHGNWTMSVHSKAGAYSPLPWIIFGDPRNRTAPLRLCCGSLIKYFHVADSSVDIFVQVPHVGDANVADLKGWDFAAGVLIVEESGGRVTDFAGERLTFPNGKLLVQGGILATSVRAKDSHDEILSRLTGT